MEFKKIIPNCRGLIALVLCMMLSIPLSANSQQKVLLPGKRVKISEIITAIEKQTSYVFAYDSSLINTKKNVTLPSEEMTVEQAVRQFANNSDYSYMIKGNFIAVTPKPVDNQPLQTSSRPIEPVLATGEKISSGEYALPGETPNGVIPTEETYYPLAEYSAMPRKFNHPSSHPSVALKTNLLYWATTTPNVALEFAVSRKMTLDLMFGYNGFKFKSTETSNRKFMHWLVSPELRYWFCKSFEGTYIGLHGFYGKYNVEDIPVINKPDFRAKGYLVGGGISVGHHWALGKRWGLEAQLGLGVAYLEYDKYDCGACGQLEKRENTTYFGPTKSTLSLIYFIK